MSVSMSRSSAAMRARAGSPAFRSRDSRAYNAIAWFAAETRVQHSIGSCTVSADAGHTGRRW
jgi:hypothetical protein